MSRSSTLAMCMTLCFLAPARAAIITVTSDSGGTGGPDCTLRDAITAKGFSGEQASALKGLVNVKAIPVDTNGVPKPGAIEEAVDAIAAQYPAMFKLEADTVVVDETDEETSTRRVVAPATPVNDGERSGDFLSMEEYNATPREVRLTKEFQARAERSKHQWPTKVNANSFPVG